jgi:steroid 5-alpha reductase family enzyme
MIVLYFEALAAISPGLVGPGSALWPIAGAALNPRQWLVAALLGPVFMYRILVHVTGIPPLEQQMLRSRGARYRDYQLRTSRFLPLPPQKGVVT